MTTPDYRMANKPNNKLANAAFILGIIAVVSAVIGTVYLPLIFGGTSIICVIISRDRDGKMDHNAVVGLILSIAGLVLNAIIVTVSVYLIFHDPSRFEEFNNTFRDFYGMDYNTYMEQLNQLTGGTLGA